MRRHASLGFSIAVYALFFATFLYLIAFVGDLPFVPRTVDRGGPIIAPGAAIAVDLALVSLFAIQHSGMARRAFKRWWTGIVSPVVERSIYVLAASLVLIAMFVFWKPVDTVLWSTSGVGAAALWTLFALGWAIVLLSTFLINHFELFGLQQAWFAFRARKAAEPHFDTPFLYRLVRHPLYLGFFLSFWAAPVMTVGRLAFAAGMSLYVLGAIQLEEKDLIHLFGERYREYRRRVGMLIPRLG